jgi:hypothetical protein
MPGTRKQIRWIGLALLAACSGASQTGTPARQAFAQGLVPDSVQFRLVVDTLAASADPGRDFSVVTWPLSTSASERGLVQADPETEMARRRFLVARGMDTTSSESWERCVREPRGCLLPRPAVAVGTVNATDWAFPSLRDDPAVARSEVGTLLITRAVVSYPDGGWQVRVFAFAKRSGRWTVAASELVGVMEGNAPVTPRN